MQTRTGTKLGQEPETKQNQEKKEKGMNSNTINFLLSRKTLMFLQWEHF